MDIFASHMFREGNQCADVLANLGLAYNHLIIWLDISDCIRATFVIN